MTLTEFETQMNSDLTEILGDDPNFDATFLARKVKLAIAEVKRRRNYGASGYTDDEIESDIQDYYPNIFNVALYDYNQTGAEFQTSHDENGINRDYMDRESLFVGVAPFVG